ncbi:MAG: hypothetical protein E7074_05180 [Bacteroidales bacterium]|nr:hypothetical protein [Bacteroidales bacterium]
MIDILLSTYGNGPWLDEFKESLKNQTFTEWRLVTRDDTLDHLGAMRSFERLFEQADQADYIAFADQDDVWLPDKLAIQMEAMRQAEAKWGKDCPIVVHTDLRVVDEHLNTIAESFWKYSFIVPELIDYNVNYLAIGNSVTGCAMLCNQAARRVSLPFGEHAYMHDAEIAMRTLLSGGHVVPVYKQTVLYRQHGDNEVGAQAYSFSPLMKERMRKARIAYAASHPLVFRSWLEFWFWKIRFFIAKL